MAVGTGAIFTEKLVSIGSAPDQFGLDVWLSASNQAVMLPLVDRYVIETGNDLFIPNVATRSATARARATDDTPSDGAEGSSITYTRGSGTRIQFTKRFVYDAEQLPWETIIDLPPAHFSAWLNAEREQMAIGLANDIDATLLALYSSATHSVGTGAGDFDYQELAEGIKDIRTSNGRGNIFGVFPETQFDHLSLSDPLTKFMNTGRPNGQAQTVFMGPGNSSIVTTNNVQTASGQAHALVFDGRGIAVAIRQTPTFKVAEDLDTFSDKIAIYMDYIYAVRDAGFLCDYALTDA